MKKGTRFLLGIFTFSILISGIAMAQITIAEDVETNSVYDDGWASTDNGGNGFSTWTFNTSGSGGRYLGGTGQGNPSFGLFAGGNGGSDFSSVERSFSDGEMLPGHQFSIDIGHSTNIATSGSVGINLKDGGSTVITLKFVGGSSNWVLNDGGSDFSAGQNYSANTSLTFTFTYEGENKYSYSFGTGSGSNFTANNTISGIDSFEVFSDDQGSGENVGFNNISLKGGTLKIFGSEGWRILSTPTSDNSYDDLLGDLWTQGIGTGADVTNGSANVQLYSNATDNFAAVTDLTATMTAGVGFITYVYSDDDYDGSDEGFPKTLSISGTENSGTVTPTLNDGADAWTLVGNPYASTIDWDLVGKTEVTGTVYVYDHSYGTPSGSDVAASGSAGSYRVWNGSAGSLTDGSITPFQGFWVQNAASVTSPSLSIEEADKATGGTFYKEVVSTTFALNAEMESLKNDTYFSFNESGEFGKDNFDGYELVPLDFADYLSLSTSINGENFDINNLPKDLEESVEIPLQVAAYRADAGAKAWIPMSGEVTLSWPMMSAIPDGWTIELQDYDTGASIDLMTESSYTFDLEATEAKTKSSQAYSALTPISVTKEENNDTGRFAIEITPSTSVSIETEDSPVVFALEQNYPNPFNPSTTISYSVKEAGAINISVYNLMGQKVATLVNETKAAGQYNVRWNAAGAASGMYYYRLEAGGQSITRKMTLIK